MALLQSYQFITEMCNNHPFLTERLQRGFYSHHSFPFARQGLPLKHSFSPTNVYQSHAGAIPFLFQKWHLNQRTWQREARFVSGNPSAVRREREMQEEAIKFISRASVLANTLYTRPPLILMILVGHASPRRLLSSTISRLENFINNSCHEKEEGTDKKKGKTKRELKIFGNIRNISLKV